MSQGVDTLEAAPSASLADSPLSNDPLFKVSEGGPPRSNRTRDWGTAQQVNFPLKDRQSVWLN
jgi:hypothetical protein